MSAVGIEPTTPWLKVWALTNVVNTHSDISLFVPALDGKGNFKVSEPTGWPGNSEGCAGYRDQPLSFRWRSPSVLVEALGLSAARNAAHEATRRMILAEALTADAYEVPDSDADRQ